MAEVIVNGKLNKSRTYANLIQSNSSISEHQQTPSISAENKIQHAIVGSTVSLRCHIADYTSGRPIVRWMRDRHILPPSAVIRGDVLQLVDVQMSDAGRYICETSNEYGTSRDYITLVINRKSQ